MKKILIVIVVVILAHLSLSTILKANNYLFVQEVKAIQQTITTQRGIADEVELTATTDVIIDINRKIAKQKAYAKIFKSYFCKEFEEIDFVK